MVVEYLSTIVSSFFLLYLEPTGLFKFASDEGVSESTIFTLMIYQLAPEVFLDIYATFMEIFAGLKTVHEVYWSPSAGANPESRYYIDRVGDLYKGTIGKGVMTMTVIIFTLASCTS